MQPLTLSLVQTATHWHDDAANRDMFRTLFDQVPDTSQLVVLPEMFSTGFTMASREVAQDMRGPTVSWLREEAARLNKVICGSVVICEQDKYFNRFLWVAPHVEPETYDKRHLFRMAGEHEHYSAGGARVALTLGDWRICPMVCYDLRFPVWFRNQGDYDLILCVANWPQARQMAWQTLLRARAIENQAFVAAVNITGTDGNNVTYAGGSAVYGADGEELVLLGDQSEVVTVTLPAEQLQQLRDNFPVWQDADQFNLLE